MGGSPSKEDTFEETEADAWGTGDDVFYGRLGDIEVRRIYCIAVCWG